MANVRDLEVYDARLLDVLELLDRGFLEVASFDVFDTLLWRKVFQPVDAFVLLGEELRLKDILRRGVDAEAFGELRQDAEAAAREKHPNRSAPEVTLIEIYAEMSPTLFGGRSPGELAEIETVFERTVTVPDLEMAAVLHAAAERSLRLVLVSDTYFSAAQLRTLLKRPVFEGLQFEVFTSSEHRTGKGQRLFEVMLDSVGAPPEKVLHIGDHPVSDVSAPETLGIKCVHYAKYAGDLARILDREIGVREGHIYRKCPRIDIVHGDFGLTSLRGKALTQYPHVELGSDLVPYWQLGAAVIGPVMAGYAEWVHQRATQEGIATVYCLMREGEFLSRMINSAGKRLESRVVAKPLWASRRVCAEASILRADVQELETFASRRKPPTVASYCGSIGLEPFRVPGFAARGHQRLDDEAVRDELLVTIANDEQLRGEVVAWSAEKRRRFLAHLEREVDLSAERIVVADLGWGASIQSYIDDALAGEGFAVDTIGLYLVTGEAAVTRMREGHRIEAFIASAGWPERVAKWITRSPEILEQVCMSDAGSLIGFAEDGTTLHTPPAEPSRQTRQRRAVQDGAVAFDQLWGRYQRLLANAPVLAGGARPALEAALLRLIVEPMDSEARLLADWLHDENFGSDSSEPIVADDLAPHLGHMTPTQFLHLPMTRVYWPFGLAALYNPPLAVAAGIVAADVAPAGAFESINVVPVTVEMDDGGGFVEKRRLEGRSNVNSLYYVRTGFLERARAVRVVFGDSPAAVRLDGLRLVLVLEDGTARTIVIEAGLGFDALSVDRGIWMADGFVLGTHAGPALSYRLPDDEPPAFRVEIEVAFGLLPIPPVERPRLVAQRLAQKAARRLRGRVGSVAGFRRSVP